MTGEKPEGAPLSEWLSGVRREPTQAERNIARAWVARHRWTNTRDADVEYEHALAILVFGNARPPLKNGRMPRKAHPRDHAGHGLPCDVCKGPCSIDEAP